jgi:hypothetical protein
MHEYHQWIPELMFYKMFIIKTLTWLEALAKLDVCSYMGIRPQLSARGMPIYGRIVRDLGSDFAMATAFRWPPGSLASGFF